jgi:hypothetical protein
VTGVLLFRLPDGIVGAYEAAELVHAPFLGFGPAGDAASRSPVVGEPSGGLGVEVAGGLAAEVAGGLGCSVVRSAP